MSPSSRRRTTCRLCNFGPLELVLHLEPTPVADNYVTKDELAATQEVFPLDLHFCRACAHVQITDVVDPSILFRNYIYITQSSLGLVEHFRKYADDVTTRYVFPSGGLVVEIGSNDGSLLGFFQKKGFTVLGVDPARDIARRATEAGVETWPEFFNRPIAAKIRRDRGSAVIVSANNVFAHSDELGGMADGIRDLLAPDGIFVFEVAYLGDFVQKKLFDTIYHEHLSYHSAGPLKLFLEKHGLELIEVDRIASKAGSLRCFAQLKGGPRKVTQSVEDILNFEKQIGLNRVETFKELAKELEANRKALIAKLAAIKSEGKKIVAYGASPSCTTLTYYFKLNGVIDYFVDDNPRKQGRFSPGYHIPVYPSSKLAEDKPDYTLILAWTYADPILKSNETYRKAGGKFIVPLPAVKEV